MYVPEFANKINKNRGIARELAHSLAFQLLVFLLFFMLPTLVPVASSLFCCQFLLRLL